MNLPQTMSLGKSRFEFYTHSRTFPEGLPGLLPPRDPPGCRERAGGNSWGTRFPKSADAHDTEDTCGRAMGSTRVTSYFQTTVRSSPKDGAEPFPMHRSLQAAIKNDIKKHKDNQGRISWTTTAEQHRYSSFQNSLFKTPNSLVFSVPPLTPTAGPFEKEDTAPWQSSKCGNICLGKKIYILCT